MLKSRFSFVAGFIFIATSATLTFWIFQDKAKVKREREIRELISKIPCREQRYLANLFRFVIFQSSFGYVLFGDKPMAFEDFSETGEISSEYLRSYYRLERGLEAYILQKGIATWIKYQHLFPSKKYLLKVKKSNVHRETTLILINRNALEKKMKKYESDFVRVLGEKLSEKELLDDFANTHGKFGQKLRRHPALLGILLGYGRDNAWLYHEWQKSRKTQSPLFENRSLTLTPFSKVPNLCFDLPVLLPGFGCDPTSEETKELRRKYSQQRQNIYKAYQAQDLLEVTLRKFTE